MLGPGAGLSRVLWHRSNCGRTDLAAYPNSLYVIALQLDALLPLVTRKTCVAAFTARPNVLRRIVQINGIAKVILA